MANVTLRPAVALLREHPGELHQLTIDQQSVVVGRFAEEAGVQLVAELAFQGSSLSDLFTSIAFRTLISLVETGRARTILVATPTGMAADPLVQTVAQVALSRRGIALLVADQGGAQPITGARQTVVEQVLTLNHEFEKRLEAMEQRQRAKIGPRRRKNYSEMFPEAVALARRLHRDSLKRGDRRSLRELSATLAMHGHLNTRGKPYHPDEVRRMILGPEPVIHRVPAPVVERMREPISA